MSQTCRAPRLTAFLGSVATRSTSATFASGLNGFRPRTSSLSRAACGQPTPIPAERGYVGLVLTGSGRLGVVVTTALIAALSVTACSSGSSTAPQGLPALSSTVSASPPQSATPSPNRPKTTAKAAELAAVSAVIARYFAIVNNLHSDMDSYALGALFTTDCVCQAQTRSVRSAAAQHEHYIDHATVNALRASTEGTNNAGVLADYNTSSGGLVDSQGRRITRTRAKRSVRWQFSLRCIDSHWLISSIQDIP
jgi:hypothetical protein